MAQLIEVSAARTELAGYVGRRGCLSLSFVGEDESLVRGNEILAGQIVGYERQKRLRQSDRTFDNIVAAVRKLVGNAPWYPEVLRALAHYLVFDALICNTDRHHENWGFLTQFEEVEPEKWMMRLRLAPSFDHASWPLPSFPEFDRKYESSELFPLFQNRVLDPGRKDFATYPRDYAFVGWTPRYLVSDLLMRDTR